VQYGLEHAALMSLIELYDMNISDRNMAYLQYVCACACEDDKTEQYEMSRIDKNKAFPQCECGYVS